MKLSFLIPFSFSLALASAAHGKASLCSSTYADMKFENAALAQSLAKKNRTSIVDTYFYAEFSAKKAVEIKPGASIDNISNIPGVVRKNTDRINIEKVMADFSLTRFQAVEVQAILRRYIKTPNDRQFIAAVKAVREGKTISQLNQEKIKKAPFTLALDIDGTLLDQDSSRKWIPKVHEKSFLVDGSEVHHVALNPGAVELIRKAKELGGAIVLFSRNNDQLIHEILNSLKLDGVSLANYVDGVLTSSHMTVPPAAREDIGYSEISRLVKKDLRILESKRVLLIDDNPAYVLQLGQMRQVSEFSLNDAIKKPKLGEDDALTDKELEDVNILLDEMRNEYKQVAQELEYLVQQPSQFKELQVVFSPLGREAFSLLTDQNKDYLIKQKSPMEPKAAIEYLLANPNTIPGILEKKIRKPKPKPKFNFGLFDIGS